MGETAPVRGEYPGGSCDLATSRPGSSSSRSSRAGAAAAAGYGLTAPKRYRATAQLLVAPVSPGDPTFAGIGVLRRHGRQAHRRSRRRRALADPADRGRGRARSSRSSARARRFSMRCTRTSSTRATSSRSPLRTPRANGAAQLANTFANAFITQRSATFQSELAAAIRRDEQLLAGGAGDCDRPAADDAARPPGRAGPDRWARVAGGCADVGGLALRPEARRARRRNRRGGRRAPRAPCARRSRRGRVRGGKYDRPCPTGPSRSSSTSSRRGSRRGSRRSPRGSATSGPHSTSCGLRRRSRPPSRAGGAGRGRRLGAPRAASRSSATRRGGDGARGRARSPAAGSRRQEGSRTAKLRSASRRSRSARQELAARPEPEPEPEPEPDRSRSRSRSPSRNRSPSRSRRRGEQGGLLQPPHARAPRRRARAGVPGPRRGVDVLPLLPARLRVAGRRGPRALRRAHLRDIRRPCRNGLIGSRNLPIIRRMNHPAATRWQQGPRLGWANLQPAGGQRDRPQSVN